eukprot:jgi/Mesen1/4177/ME000219S03309
MSGEQRRQALLARHAASASLAIGAATAVAYPLSTIKAHIQHGANPGEAVKAATAFAKIYTSDGLRGLYRGVGVHLCGRPLALAARFGAYELAAGYHRGVVVATRAGLDGRGSMWISPGEALTAGMAAGFVEALVSTPFSLLRTRLQVATPLLPTAADIHLSSIALKQPHALLPSGTAAAFHQGSGSSAAAGAGGKPLGQVAVGQVAASPSAAPPPSGMPAAAGGAGQHVPYVRGETLPPAGAATRLSPGGGPAAAELLLARGPFGKGLGRYPWGSRNNVPAGSAWEVLRGTVAGEGWRQLWRGWRSSAATSVVYSGVLFATWHCLEQLSRELSALRAGRDIRCDGRDARLAVLLNDTCRLPAPATAAAAAGALASHPFDTALLRTQASVLPKHVMMERSLLRIRESMKWWEKLAGLRAWEKGIHWHGVGARVAYHSAAMFVLVGMFQLSLKLLCERPLRP